MWQYQKTDELYHHGVLGMKWGVRKNKYQNKKNKLTDEMEEVRKSKGAGSSKYRKLAKERYLTDAKIGYADAKNKKDKTDIYYAKQALKYAKSIKKSAIGNDYFKSARKEIFGKKLSDKELDTIAMKEDKLERRKEVGSKITSGILGVIGTVSITAGPIIAKKYLKNGIRIGNTIYRIS